MKKIIPQLDRILQKYAVDNVQPKKIPLTLGAIVTLTHEVEEIKGKSLYLVHKYKNIPITLDFEEAWI